MQKVVGSSPIIRFAKRPANAGFLLSGAATHPAAWQQNGNGRAASSDPGPAVEPIDFDAYVDVLRQRLFDYEALHNDGPLPHFDDLMSDYADVAPQGWPEQAYDELVAQGHLEPKASGQSMGPHSFGRLSADGRYHVRQQRQDD